jgi:DNA processing protein
MRPLFWGVAHVDAAFDLLTFALLPKARATIVRELSRRAPLAEVLKRPREHADLICPEALAALASGAAARAARAELERVRAAGAALVGWDDRTYPARLKQIYDPPPVLYVRGRLAADEGEPGLAVVGSRGASAQGGAFARSLAHDLAAAGICVISGLARGIDSEAHRGALAAHGRTVAVLGSGLDRVYPPENVGLARAIEAADGAVVTEQPFGRGPARQHFPLRNRIIAGLGLGVVVVEAAAKSGALGTARAALDEGREVFAVPGHPASPLAAGTNALIRDGACLVRDARDVLAELGIEAPLGGPVCVGGDALLAALRPDAPAGVEELSARCGLPLDAALARLLELELEGLARRLPGALYVRSGSRARISRVGEARA